MEVILLIGIAGSGKTIFCTKFLPNHTRISLDEVPNHDRAKQAELIENGLLEKQNIVIDDTNLTREIRSKHILIAKKYNAEIKAVFFDLPMFKIQLQNSKREKKLVDSALFKMKKILEPPSEDEGINFIQIIS